MRDRPREATARRVLLGAVLFACGTVACNPSSAPRVKKVLLIGLDGVRVDVLAQAYTPNIDSLVATGFFSDRAQTSRRTVSGPAWSSMLTGVWPDKHLVNGNDFTGNDYATYPEFLTRIEQIQPERNTFTVVDWPPLGGPASGGPLLSAAVDVLTLIDGDELGYAAADSLSVAAAVNHLRYEDPDAAFVYLGNIDVVGHATSSLATEYSEAIEWADQQVGQLLAAVQNRATYADEDWLILMGTDHGRNDAGGHGGQSEQELTVFYLASGPSVLLGAPAQPPHVVDIAVTALTHLGIEISPGWNLDGVVAGLREER